MSAKVIKLQDNSNNTLLPVTDASLVQMTVGTETKSVQDVILEDEEVTAAGYTDLNDRVTVLEEADYITQDELSSNSYITTSTETQLSKGTTTGSGNAVTDISVSGHQITLTKGTTFLTNLNNQSKDFGKVQTITDETGTGAGTTTKGTMNADVVKDVLQVKGGNKWITTGVNNTTAESTSDNDILVINHAINPSGSDKTVTLSGIDTGTFGSTEYITGISYNVDPAGHIATITATTSTLPKQTNVFNKIANSASGFRDIITYTAPLTTAGTATADTTQDTLNVHASNYWIRTNVTDTSNNDVLTIGHSLASNSVTSASKTLYGNETIISTSYNFDFAGHRTGTHNTTYTLSLDASYINITYNETTKSVKDAILENEEVTAIALNELNDRVDNTIETVENITPLIVNFSSNLSLSTTCDTSIDDIQDAYYAGRNIIARTVDGQLNLVQCNSSSVIFTNSHTNTLFYYTGSKVNNSDQWNITTTSLDEKADKVIELTEVSGFVAALSGTESSSTTLTTEQETELNSVVEKIEANNLVTLYGILVNIDRSTLTWTDTTSYGRLTFMYSKDNTYVNCTIERYKENGIWKYYSDVSSATHELQANLVSGTNIKTINSTSLLGSGDIALQTPLTFDNTPISGSTNPVKSDGIKTYVDNSFKNSVIFAQCNTNSSAAGATMIVTDSNYVAKDGAIVTIFFKYAVPDAAKLNINGAGAKNITMAVPGAFDSQIMAGVIKAGDAATFIYTGGVYKLINVSSIANPNLTCMNVSPTNGAMAFDGSTATKILIPNKVYYISSGEYSNFSPITSLSIGNYGLGLQDTIYDDVNITASEKTPYNNFLLPVYQIFFKTGSSCSITLGNKMIWKDNLAPTSSDLSNKYCELTIMNKIATLISVDIP